MKNYLLYRLAGIIGNDPADDFYITKVKGDQKETVRFHRVKSVDDTMLGVYLQPSSDGTVYYFEHKEN